MLLHLIKKYIDIYIDIFCACDLSRHGNYRDRSGDADGHGFT